MNFIEDSERVKETRQRLENIGLTDLRSSVAATAVCLGAKEVLAVHGASPKKLQLVFKTDGTQSSRTLADLRSGSVIKAIIREFLPHSRINEEETGVSEGVEFASEVDPLDGTGSFARAQRYSTVGIEFHNMDGTPIAAAICNPFEREVLIAEKGKGAFLFRLGGLFSLVGRPQRLSVSDIKTLNGACGYVDAYDNEFNRTPKRQFRDMIDELSGVNGRINFNWRQSGSNIDQQRQVAAGRAEFTLTDAVGGFFDLAAGRLMIEEAGGVFTDQFGNPIKEGTQFGIGSNGWIHNSLVRVTQEVYKDYLGYNPKPIN